MASNSALSILYVCTHLIMKLQRYKSIIFAAFLLTPLLAFAQDAKLALASNYVNLRGATWGLQQVPKPPASDAQRQELIKSLLDALVGGNAKSKHWAAEHPARRALNDALAPDLTRLGDLIFQKRDLAPLAKRIEDAFVQGIASLFTEKELQELIAYYSRPLGRLFISKQQALNNMVQSSLLARQTNVSPNVEYPRRTNPDPGKLAELLGLFDEVVRIQLAISDPGPGGDRTGLGAIGFITSAGVVDAYPEILAEWEKIPEKDREEILSWRKSAPGLNEREVIYKAAGKIRTVYKPEQGMQEVLRATVEFEIKTEHLIDRLAAQFP